MRVLVPERVLTELGHLFVANGRDGCETSAMLLARRDGTVVRAVVPDQRAKPAPYCSVEITERGKLDLAAALTDTTTYVARIHSHPREAFHSAADDANSNLNHHGAISIVAPNFGETLFDGLEACAIYRRQDRKWVELPAGPERDNHIRWMPNA